MSFFKAFNPCCPFLISPHIDVEDGEQSDSNDINDSLDYEDGLKEYEKKHKDMEYRKRFKRYAIFRKLKKLNFEADAQPQNISNIIVNDILNKIVY